MTDNLSNRQPTVSIIVPVCNEAAHIGRCLESLLVQDYPDIVEILVFDGVSEDGTRDVVERIQKRHAPVRLLDNPARVQTAALNSGLDVAKGEVIVWGSAHATYDPCHVSEVVRTLLGKERAGAALGPMHLDLTKATTPIASAIAAAHRSRFGIGAGRFHDTGAEGYTDAGYPGGYWRSLLARVGGFRTELLRTEDIDLNSRLRALGYGVYLNPRIKAYYSPRTTLKALWRQNFANGMGIMQSLFVNHKALSFRHLVPFAFVTSLATGLALAPIWWVAKALLSIVGIAYVFGVTLFSLVDGLRYCPSCVPLMPLVFATAHLSYGVGSIWGLFRSVHRRLRFGDVNIFGVETQATDEKESVADSGPAPHPKAPASRFHDSRLRRPRVS